MKNELISRAATTNTNETISLMIRTKILSTLVISTFGIPSYPIGEENAKVETMEVASSATVWVDIPIKLLSVAALASLQKLISEDKFTHELPCLVIESNLTQDEIDFAELTKHLKPEDESNKNAWKIAREIHANTQKMFGVQTYKPKCNFDFGYMGLGFGTVLDAENVASWINHRYKRALSLGSIVEIENHFSTPRQFIY